jgi:hypothetical protein
MARNVMLTSNDHIVPKIAQHRNFSQEIFFAKKSFSRKLLSKKIAKFSPYFDTFGSINMK